MVERLTPEEYFERRVEKVRKVPEKQIYILDRGRRGRGIFSNRFVLGLCIGIGLALLAGIYLNTRES